MNKNILEELTREFEQKQKEYFEEVFMKNNINEAMALSFNAAIVKFLAADVMFNFIYESLKKIKNTETLYKKISRNDRKQFDYYFHEMETICILVERILTHSYNMIVEKE